MSDAFWLIFIGSVAVIFSLWVTDFVVIFIEWLDARKMDKSFKKAEKEFLNEDY